MTSPRRLKLNVSDVVIAWFIIFAATVWMCACCPKPPACPKPLPPPPVVTVVHGPPCKLPAEGKPVDAAAAPDKEHGGYLVMPDKWAALVGSHAADAAWKEAARGCLEAAGMLRP